MAATLTTAAEVLGGGREAAVCRELTKTYEEVRRGSLAELAAWAEEGVRGEITVVISAAGADGSGQVEVADLVPLVEEKVASGVRLKGRLPGGGGPGWRRGRRWVSRWVSLEARALRGGSRRPRTLMKIAQLPYRIGVCPQTMAQ